MALVVASLAWLYPARTIRAQVLTIRERSYVQVARLSGVPGRMIIFARDTAQPVALPGGVAGHLDVGGGAGLDRPRGAGAGPMDAPTIGMTLFWINYNAAVINGWWWWWLPPIVVIGMLFISLFLTSVGLDEIANPRIRRSV